MRADRRSPEAWRHVFLTLAAFALVLKVMIPTGWMVGPSNDGLPFPLVICTGQGAMTLATDQAAADQQAPNAPAHEKSVKHAPCAFAGQGAAFESPAIVATAPVTFAFDLVTPPPATPHRAGPGITGPPLPARGPPTLSI
jgi:hypothetical protein